MTVGTSPMVRRRRLGAEVRQLREQHKLTNEQLAARLGWSVAKLSRLENARVRPDLADIMNLLDELGVTGAKREQLVTIARDAADTGGWWLKYNVDVNQRHLAYAEMENAAVDIQEFQLTMVPGLLQTAEYARTRFNSGRAANLPPVNVEAAVEARQTRQRVLTRDAPLTYRALLDETVIVRRCGPPGVLRDQLAHLIKVAGLPTVELRLLGFDAHVKRHYLPPCSFSHYRFADPADPEIVMLETGTSDLQLGDEEDVMRYRLIFTHLWEAALDAENTLALLATARDHAEEDLDE